MLTKESEIHLQNLTDWKAVLAAAEIPFTEKDDSLLCKLEKTVGCAVRSVTLLIKQLADNTISASITGKGLPFHEKDDEPQLLCVLPSETLVLNPAHAIVLLRKVRYTYFL